MRGAQSVNQRNFGSDLRRLKRLFILKWNMVGSWCDNQPRSRARSHLLRAQLRTLSRALTSLFTDIVPRFALASLFPPECARFVVFTSPFSFTRDCDGPKGASPAFVAPRRALTQTQPRTFAPTHAHARTNTRALASCRRIVTLTSRSFITGSRRFWAKGRRAQLPDRSEIAGWKGVRWGVFWHDTATLSTGWSLVTIRRLSTLAQLWFHRLIISMPSEFWRAHPHPPTLPLEIIQNFR